MFERFSKDARRLIIASIETANQAGAAKVGPEHLLLALAADDQSTGARILAGYGVTAAALQAETPSIGRAGLTENEIAALRSVGVDAEEVFRRIEEVFGPEALRAPSPEQRPRRRGRIGGPLDQRAKKALELSLREAIALGHREIGTGHLLLGLLRNGLTEPMSTVLSERGVGYDGVRQQVTTASGKAA